MSMILQMPVLCGLVCCLTTAGSLFNSVSETSTKYTVRSVVMSVDWLIELAG